MATTELERRLHSTVKAQRIGQAANNLRAHPNWEGIITALLRLHEHLQANPPPIDYQRRRSLNYDNLLPETHWVDLVAEQGAGTTATTATAARLWLIEQLSGAPVPNTQQALHCRGACTDRMRRTLTPQLVKRLNTVAVDFLRAHGVLDEPPTWEPPLTLLEGLTVPGTAPEARHRDPLLISVTQPHGPSPTKTETARSAPPANGADSGRNGIVNDTRRNFRDDGARLEG